MDLTTLARAKVYAEGTGQKFTSSRSDALLERLIDDYSAEFETYLNRQVRTVSASSFTTEYFDVACGQRVFRLKAYPVSAVSAVHSDSTWNWTTGEIESDEYNLQDQEGVLRIVYNTPIPGPGNLRVIYRGGMAASSASFIASYPDIAGAMDKQIAYHMQRKSSLGATGVGVGGDNVSWQGAIDLLPSVRKVLNKHKRWQI